MDLLWIGIIVTLVIVAIAGAVMGEVSKRIGRR